MRRMAATTGPEARRQAEQRERRAKALVVSLAVHALIAAAILGTAWGIAANREREVPAVVLTADFLDPAPRTARSAPQAPAGGDTAPARGAASTADLSQRLRALEAASGANAEMDALARRFGAETSGEGAAATRTGASFAGLVSGNATKVAYVVDASGSMIGSFPAIVDEVERSLSRLEPAQQFTVICFRRDGAVSLDNDPSLRPATRAARGATVEWLRRSVVPSGRSSPVEALAQALRSGADCVFLLSTTVTGRGRAELDRDATLAMLEKLTPRDPATGRRRATIQCIQFLDIDPGRTLESVAAEHYGAGGYRFIGRGAAGLSPADGRNAGPNTP